MSWRLPGDEEKEIHSPQDRARRIRIHSASSLVIPGLWEENMALKSVSVRLSIIEPEQFVRREKGQVQQG